MSLWRKILLVYILAHQLPNTLNGEIVDPTSTPTRTPTPKSIPTQTAALSSTLTATPSATATLTKTATLTETATPIRKPAPTPKATPKPKLRCLLCHSENSWEHCDKESKVVNCAPGFDEACLTMKMNEWEKKNGTKTGKVLTRYLKHCAALQLCSDAQCKEIGSRCTVECCTEDLCNSNAAVLATLSHHHNIITLILTAILGLATVDVY